jgi:hypothetical protein
MASNLEVEIDGLRTASSASTMIAAGLADGALTEPVSSSRPSGAGIAALDAVCGAVRTRQSDRIAAQAADLSSAGTRYDDADHGHADALDGAI